MQTLELTEFGKILSEELSGGLRQRILIAMTIACDVDLMYLTSLRIGLDPVGRRRVWNELIRLKEEEGRTIVLTTHYMDEAEALSDEHAIIDHRAGDGKGDSGGSAIQASELEDKGRRRGRVFGHRARIVWEGDQGRQPAEALCGRRDRGDSAERR